MLNNVINYFKEISCIPRWSWNEEEILSYFENWAEKKWFNYKVDIAKNIVIYVPASIWREDEKIVILQWHMDMVCTKKEDLNHNFKKDPLKIIEENWFIKAQDTTLWADNGIWLAIMMVLNELDSHPSLELLITSSEEIWLIWALSLEEKNLDWKYLINLDSEDEWEITISSAGWAEVKITWESKTKDSKFKKFRIKLFWMKGWHSWVEIDKNRWNCNFEFIKFLDRYDKELELISIKWWFADNVISSSLDAIIWVEDFDYMNTELEKFKIHIKETFDSPDFSYSIEKEENEFQVFDSRFVNDIFKKIIKSWDWVIKMSKNINSLVQTSSNLWILDISNSKIKISYCLRSSSTKDLEEMLERFKLNFWGLNVKELSIYPGWEWQEDDYLSKIVKESYDEVIDTESKFVALHAWLECWAIVEKLWSKIQAVSIWPNIRGAHSVEEKCEIKSVEVICNIIKKVLENKFI